MRIDIPFIKSRELECGQACAAMMIKYYFPEFEPDFDEFDELIGHKPGLYTFPSQSVILLDHYGIKVKCFSSKEYPASEREFINSWGAETWNIQKKYIDVENFIKNRKRMLNLGLFEKKAHSLSELLEYTLQGFVVGIAIDWNTLSGEGKDYQGHFVIISGVEGSRVLIHDPDFVQFMYYDFAKLDKAYEHPIIDDDAIVVFGKKQND